ncbi:MAG: FoF1 ATP synthase subunit gamma, partial [Clostridia bacterium]
SSKMSKAMNMHAMNMRYFERARSDIRFILDNTQAGMTNPYYREHGIKAGYVVIAGDQGLCGGYNADVCKLALETIKGGTRTCKKLFTIGHVASDFFIRQGMEPDTQYQHVIQDPNLQNVRVIMSDLRTLFRSKVLDEVYVVYTTQEKVGQLTPRVLRLLPVLRADFEDAKELHAPTLDLTYHPSAAYVLESIIPHYLVGLFYSALVQSYASEQYARMSAMDAATRSANEMQGKLKLTLNHARQALITQEISEIISGSPMAE